MKSSLDRIHREFDENDSSASTTNRSVHLPVEKQRGQSEIIRKRNSRFKVEDYKRSFQRSNTCDEPSTDYYRPLSSSISDYTLSSNPMTSTANISPRQTNRLSKTKSVDVSLGMNTLAEGISNEYGALKCRLCIDCLSLFRNDQINQKMTVAAKKSLFETFNKINPGTRGLTRSKSFKQER